MLLHPFQKLCHVKASQKQHSTLLAASGSNIVIFDLANGSVLAIYQDANSALDDAEIEFSPAKRRKLDNGDAESSYRDESEDSVEIVAERQKGERRKPKPAPSAIPPNISHLLATSDGRHVVTVTIEDKSINVFSLRPSGQLILKSSRSMPKRLCSIVLAPGDETIVAADKFGDVYSLPLLPQADFVPQEKRTVSNDSFRPSASESTVHTRGNLEALRQQREQRMAKVPREGLTFQHKLLLGHVSLLTDIAIVEETVASKQRQFLFTADRDEHIRISRYPQAHVIEGYCLGHREFVSKVCVVPWNQKLLVSGGGEAGLKLWAWGDGKLLDEVPLDRTMIAKAIPNLGLAEADRDMSALAVSGIWPLPNRPNEDGVLLVAVEAMPVLFSFVISHKQTLEFCGSFPARGNILDIAVDAEAQILIVSLDHVHRPGSKTRMANAEKKEPLFQILSLGPRQSDSTLTNNVSQKLVRWTEDNAESLNDNAGDALKRCAELRNEGSDAVNSKKQQQGERGTLSEFLYSLENLRKKRASGAGEDLDDQPDVGHAIDI